MKIEQCSRGCVDEIVNASRGSRTQRVIMSKTALHPREELTKLTDEEKYRLYWEVVGKVILELENYQGFSHTEVASRGGLGRDVVGKLVHGNSMIQLQSFVKICHGLGIAPGLVLSMADECWVQYFAKGDIKKYQRLQKTLVFLFSNNHQKRGEKIY